MLVICEKCYSKYLNICVAEIIGIFVDSLGTIICCENKQVCKVDLKNVEIKQLKSRFSIFNESQLEK